MEIIANRLKNGQYLTEIKETKIISKEELLNIVEINDLKLNENYKNNVLIYIKKTEIEKYAEIKEFEDLTNKEKNILIIKFYSLNYEERKKMDNIKEYFKYLKEN